MLKYEKYPFRSNFEKEYVQAHLTMKFSEYMLWMTLWTDWNNVFFLRSVSCGSHLELNEL